MTMLVISLPISMAGFDPILGQIKGQLAVQFNTLEREKRRQDGFLHTKSTSHGQQLKQ